MLQHLAGTESQKAQDALLMSALHLGVLQCVLQCGVVGAAVGVAECSSV